MISKLSAQWTKIAAFTIDLTGSPAEYTDEKQQALIPNKFGTDNRVCLRKSASVALTRTSTIGSDRGLRMPGALDFGATAIDSPADGWAREHPCQYRQGMRSP